MERLKKYKRQSTFGAIVVVLLLLIGFTGGGKKALFWLERFTGDVFAPVISLTTQGTKEVAKGVHTIVHLPLLEKENKKSLNEN